MNCTTCRTKNYKTTPPSCRRRNISALYCD